MRIGVDVGGTNTDAVIMDGREVLATQKVPTTPNISDGIVRAISAVVEASKAQTIAIRSVMIGTTQFTNAFVERRGLLPVAAIRIALPSSRGVPPLTDWPQDLQAMVGKAHYMVRGSYFFDGRVCDELDELAVARAARDLRIKGLKAVAVTGIFSPVNAQMELRAEEIIRNEAPDAAVTLSSKVGRMGILERENAAVVNASLAELSKAIVGSFHSALQRLNIKVPFYISQNDGTLMSSEFVEQYPVLTFASGPTNSMRGAAYLSNLENALVADIGGTTTDFGLLLNGFPRESALARGIGGVRTNFRMPDILSVGLGGGSLVARSGDGQRIGPQSLGYRVTEESLAFGGDRLCATDIAVAGGWADIGDRSLVAHLPKALIKGAATRMHTMLANAVDQIKISQKPMPLVLVGGGVVLIHEEIDGVSEMVIPEHAAVANAVGASITQISGEIDRIFAYEADGREAALEQAKKEAETRAVEAGADRGNLRLLDLDEVPLAYMPGGATRIRVKVTGNPIDAPMDDVRTAATD